MTRVQIPARAPLSEVNVPSAFKGVPHHNNVKDDIYNTERSLQLLINSLAKLEKKEDAELIRAFVKVLEAQGLSKRRVLKYVSHLKLVSKHLKVSFAKATRKDIEELMAWINSQNYSPQTVQGIIVVLRRFYQWLRAKPEEYEEWRREHTYPPEVSWLKETIKLNEMETKVTLSDDEVKALIQASNDPMLRAFISLEDEVGARPSEILNLRIGDIVKDGNDVIVNIRQGKTGYRSIPIIKSVSLLFQWLELHPLKNDPNAPLWLSRSNRNRFQKWSYRACDKALKLLAKKAGIKKDVSIYTFRHTSATRDAKLGFTEAQLCLKYGWKIGSRVPSVYLHLSAKDLRDVVRNIYGGKPLEPPKPQTIECPKCHALNHPSQNYCSNCGAPLNLQEIAQKSVSIEELKYRIDKLTDIISKLLNEKQRS
ncbi:MAG: site-specific integrase [Nitrososphaeria archaeon]